MYKLYNYEIKYQKDMRLTKKQIKAIWDVFSLHFIKVDSIWFLSSRTDYNKKGGDIDLYKETLN